MANDGLDGRKVLILPPAAEGLRGQHRTSAVQAQALCLSDAIAGALDRIPIFEHDGRPVLLVDGALRTVNSEVLRWTLEGYFVTPHLVQREGRLELEYRGVRPNEMVARSMLTAEPKQGGLLGKLPRLEIEQPRQQAAPPAEPRPVVMDGSKEAVERARGQEVLARFTNPEERTRLEMARGAEVLAKYQSQRAAVETPAVEEHPVFIDKTDDSPVDPASTQA
jgi:hypothetical protein